MGKKLTALVFVNVVVAIVVVVVVIVGVGTGAAMINALTALHSLEPSEKSCDNGFGGAW